MNLRKKTNNGLQWSAIEKFANRGLSFCIQILLARLVDPTEFGLLTLVAIFVAFCNVVIDAGFGQAIIQKKDVSKDDVSTVFFANMAISFAMYVLAFWAAPKLAAFYNEPRLTLLLRILALNFIVRAFGIIQSSLLIRNLEFQKLFKIATPAVVLAGVVGVVMAWLEFEVWALVAYQMIHAGVMSVCFWLFSDRELWPERKFSSESFWSMGKFGFGMLGSALFTQGVQRMYGLVIAKQFNFAQLAFYNRARSFHQTPSQSLSQILNRVLFPVFSTIQDDNKRIVSAIRKGMPLLAFALFPAMAFLMVAADNIIVVLLTKKWLPSAGLMRWFPIVGMIYPIAAIQLSVIRAKGRSGIYFWFTVIKNVLAIVTLAFTINHGVLAVILGQVGCALFNQFCVNMPASQRIIGYRCSDQLVDILPYAACALAAAGFCFLFENLITIDSDFVELCFKAIVFASSYAVLCFAFRLTGITEAFAKITSGYNSLSASLSDRQTA